MRKPKLIISRCLNSEKCRYDGNGFDDKVISLIRDYVDIETVCPESDIGLPMPRDPIRIEKDEDSYKLIQTKTNRDYSDMMTEFAEEFVSGIDDIDGFILKSRSPTCGIKDVLNDEDIDLYNKKVYEILEKKRSKRSSIKAAQFIFAGYKDKLTEKEITYFERLLDLYQEEKIPFSSVKTALQIYGLRFDDSDLLNQTFFNFGRYFGTL